MKIFHAKEAKRTANEKINKLTLQIRALDVQYRRRQDNLNHPEDTKVPADKTREQMETIANQRIILEGKKYHINLMVQMKLHDKGLKPSDLGPARELDIFY